MDQTTVLTPQQEFQVLERHVKSFEREFLSRGTLPKKDDWRPHRFCVRDVVLGIVVIKHDTKNNTLKVDFCLSENPPFLREYEGTQVVTLFLLSEAFMCGSSMGIEFTKNVNGGTVPPLIYDLAYLSGVQLKKAGEGLITPKESRQLYMALTGFSEEVQHVIMELAVNGKVSPERVCYMVNNGIWLREEIEILLMGSTFPECSLLGEIDWKRFLLLENCLMAARTAILGGTLLRKLGYREVIKDGKVVDLESNERVLNVHFNGEFQALEVTCGENFPVPWLSSELVINPGERMIAKLISRDGPSTFYYKKEDLKSLTRLISFRNSDEHESKNYYFVVVPLDAFEKSDDFKKYKKRVSELGAQVLVCPDPVSDMDKEAFSRLERSEVTRQ